MSNEWSNFDLNEKILSNLNDELKFESPTEIQSRVLLYLNSKVDLIIQAKTGEGKTLCYAIPIINYILNFYERAEDKIKKISPVALILVPTRELGLQVHDHIAAILKDLSGEGKHYFNIRIANVLGGFAKAKQIKILAKYSPEIIIATPGRLWEIIENEECPLFNKFFKLRFLVLDEADRMTEKGHFRELKKILGYIYNKLETVDIKSISEEESTNSVKSKVKKLMPNEDFPDDKTENRKLQKVLKNKGFKVDINNIESIDPMELFADEDMIDNFNVESQDEDEEVEDLEAQTENPEGADEDEIEEMNEPQDEVNEDDNIFDENKFKRSKREEDKIPKNVTPKHQIHLRTILCSATIESLHSKKKDTRRGKDKHKNKNKEETKENEDKLNLEGLVKNAKFYNKLIYVRNTSENPEGEFQNDHTEDPHRSNLLPERLELDCYRCDSNIKDYYLLHLLKANEGKSIVVFTNSISHTKKIYSIFSFFDFKLTVLHSKMQQSQRIKNLDKFRKKESLILFCTDVGARGLDVPLVDIVIHYHIPKTTQLFIHRSGRTARATKEGTSISLISETELSIYKNIMKDLKINEFGMRTLSLVQLEKYKSLFEFTRKLEKEDHSIKKKQREKQWFDRKADECEMIFNEDKEDDIEESQREIFLNKKRKMIQKDKFKEKKVFHSIASNNIKRTSFLNSDLVQKLNSMVNSDSMSSINLTQAIFQANADAQAFRYKGKPQKKRYMRRRKNK